MGFDLPFGLTVDTTFWEWFLTLPIYGQGLVLFAMGGWVVLANFFFKAGLEFWTEYRQSTKNTSNWQWVVLAVDIPPLFIQSPKAVEQIFAHLSGALGHANVQDKFWFGKKQKWFSFEIISIEGYIQFLVRTEVEFRDLVEAAIYAQYTEAEITEVEDYVNNIPDRYPDSEYDIMGIEFKLSEPAPFPIRTYENFEYTISKDAVFSDPMAAILENFSRIGHGENLWMHIIVEPTGNSWKEEGIELAKTLMSGEEAGHGHHGGGGVISEAISTIPQAILKLIISVINWNFETEHHEEEKPKKVELTPGTKKTVEAIEEKISKIGFKSKVRALYAARSGTYQPNRCIEGLVGAMNQFHSIGKNGLVPYMVTHAHYDSKHQKSFRLKNTFVKSFKKRKIKWKRSEGYILNIEELATIWHFPLPFVKTPLLQKAGAKRAEPPSGLPVDSIEGPLKKKGAQPPVSAPVPPPDLPEEAPENLPFG